MNVDLQQFQLILNLEHNCVQEKPALSYLQIA